MWGIPRVQTGKLPVVFDTYFLHASFDRDAVNMLIWCASHQPDLNVCWQQITVCLSWFSSSELKRRIIFGCNLSQSPVQSTDLFPSCWARRTAPYWSVMVAFAHMWRTSGTFTEGSQQTSTPKSNMAAVAVCSIDIIYGDGSPTDAAYWCGRVSAAAILDRSPFAPSQFISSEEAGKPTTKTYFLTKSDIWYGILFKI